MQTFLYRIILKLHKLSMLNQSQSETQELPESLPEFPSTSARESPCTSQSDHNDNDTVTSMLSQTLTTSAGILKEISNDFVETDSKTP